MNLQLFFEQKAYRFKRFAKKNYSAFNSMHKTVSIGVLSASMLIFANMSPVQAQKQANMNADKSPTEQELEEVVVTASSIETSASQASRLVTVISAADIQQAPVKSIQDLLTYFAGVDVIQRGGHGIQTDISIRGGSFDQTAILLNGVNLSNPQTGHYSFDIPINLSDIDHIEIIHGPSSLVYGASAFSGGINIVTKKELQSNVYGRIEGGSHNTYQIEGKGSHASKHFINQLSTGYAKSDGYVENSDYEIINSLFQSQFRTGDYTKVDLQLGLNNKEFGANTFYSPVYPNQFDKTTSYLVSLKGETGSQKFKIKPLVYWNRHDDEFQLFREGTPNLPSWYTDHNYHKSEVMGGLLNLQYISRIGQTSFVTEIRNEKIHSSVLGKPMSEPEGKYTKSDERTNISHTIEHKFSFYKFNISAAILFNKNTGLGDDSYKLYPAINASYQIQDFLKIYGSWNKATRMPTFTDLYYSTATHIGNPNLSPENSEAFEVGFKYNNGIVNAHLVGFLMKGKNVIDWVKASEAEKFTAQNWVEVDRKGFETGVQINLKKLNFATPLNSIQLGYTRMNQKKDDKNLISSYANHLRDKFTIGLNHDIYKSVTANWNFRFQKRMGIFEKYEDGDKSLSKYPSYSTLDLKINWKINKSFDSYISINNLYDTDYYDIGNVPQSGFWFSVGGSYTLR